MTMRTAVGAALVLGLSGSAHTEPPRATTRIPQLENEAVRVWKSIIAPGQPLSLHRHENGRVIVALRGGDLKIVQENGTARVVTWETGRAYWLAADPPGERHGDVNEGQEPIEVMVVELQPRQPAPGPDGALEAPSPRR